MSKKVKKIILISVSAVLAVALITTGVIVTAKYFKNYVGDTVISFEEKTGLSATKTKISANLSAKTGFISHLSAISHTILVLSATSREILST